MTASIPTFIRCVDAYKAAAGITKDRTVSSRVFGHALKIEWLRAGRVDITTGRLHNAMLWFRDNWPVGSRPPAELLYAIHLTELAAVGPLAIAHRVMP
jgi:hypothetical protein